MVKELNKEGIPTVEELRQLGLERKKKINNYEEKYKKVIYARGTVLEYSTALETSFNEYILKTGGEYGVIDNEKKELHMITGLKTMNELGSFSSFNKRLNLYKELLEKSSENHPLPKYFLDTLDRFAAIRDIFAHVPINWFSTELEFNDKPPYKHFFKFEPRWKNLSLALSEFMIIQKLIVDSIHRYIQLILLNQKIVSTILLGADFEDTLKKELKQQ